MDPQQIRDVQAIMERLWGVEDSAPAPDHASVLAAARVAVDELRGRLAELGGEGDPLDVGRTWRYLGDTYFSLSAKTDQGALRSGREAYLAAEPLLNSAGDLLEKGKLQFNLANTTRLIDGGQNRELLEEAKRRYRDARELFKSALPDAVPTVESSLQSLEIMLRGLGFLEAAAAGKAKTEGLMEQLKAAGDDAGKLADVQTGLEDLKSEGASPEEMLAHFSTFVGGVAPLLEDEATEGQAERFAEARGELDSLLTNSQGSDGSDLALFQMMFAKLEKAAAGGEVGPQRQAALRSVLEGFQRLVARPAKTPEEMAGKVADMREHIEKYKAIFMDPEMGGE